MDEEFEPRIINALFPLLTDSHWFISRRLLEHLMKLIENGYLIRLMLCFPHFQILHLVLDM